MDQLFSLWGPAAPFFWVRALWALALLLATLRIASAAQRGTRSALTRVGAHVNAILLLERVARLAIVSLGVVLMLALLGIELSALAALVGLGAVALSLSAQDIARSLLAGLYLLVERPFDVGDVVEVGGQQGVVEDVGFRTTTLRSASDDRVIVPNLVLFTSVIVKKKANKEPV